MTLKPPVFLERAGYRLRRATDAARILPVVAAVLFLLPLLWHGGATRQGVVFLFVVWLGLIVIAGLLSRPLSTIRDKDDAQSDKGPSNGSV